MSEISVYTVAILVAVALFGAVLGFLHLLQVRRFRSVTRVVRRMERRAVKPLDQREKLETVLREEEDLRPRASLYGIPYLAWILTSVIVLACFFVFFFENLVAPYGVPQVAGRALISYRAPAGFLFSGEVITRHRVLIPEGKTITEADRSLVREALARRGRVSGTRVLGTLMLLLVFFTVLLYHMNILYPTSTEKNRNLILIYLVIFVVVACAKIALFYDLFSPFLIPIPWAGMLITILINRRIVPLAMLIAALLASIVSDFDLSLFLVLLAGGLVSGTWVRRARKRSEIILASTFLGAVMMLVFVCSSMLRGWDLSHSYATVFYSFVNGPSCGLLVIVSLPVLERLFDLTSMFSLMELLDLNTPLLKELFFKAQGTYQHSLAVASIGEKLAAEIGANDLLVRVGSYYHDIGKIFNPDYFIENQRGGDNPHDRVGPIASAAVLRSHVILGARLARRIKLPGPIIDFITQHHGTSTIDYFLYKSKQMESEMKSDRVFRYPGPKPQSRETAIVMLVDSVEAASRLLSAGDDESIRETIQRVARRKLEQGQFDQSGLTIGEFRKVTDTLSLILKGRSHQRLDYPTPAKSLPDQEPLA